MAAAAPNSVAALTANQFGGDNTASTCLDDPNFATICSFIQNFGEIIRIGRIPFDDLQQMLENTADVPLPLVQLHITLLRRVFKSVTHDKWERSLAKFGHTYCSQDAWEIERFGYKKAKIQTKLRLLKNLLEAQFDYNVKFKSEVNKLQAADLRLTPLGRDTEGQVYWYQVDEDANLRVYREDIDDETWEIVASNRDELEDLISQLQRGEVKKPEPEETIIVPEEDSNSKDDIEPKEIILDTGKVEEDGSSAENTSDGSEDIKLDKRTVEPLIIKHNFNLNKIHNSDVDKVESSADNIKYEISKSSESEPKGSGIKLVFGVKSKPKVESAQANEDVSLPENEKPPTEIIASSKDYENTPEVKLSKPEINFVSSEQPVATSLDIVHKSNAGNRDATVQSPKSSGKPLSMPADKDDHKIIDSLNNELSAKTERPELQIKTEQPVTQFKKEQLKLETKGVKQQLFTKDQQREQPTVDDHPKLETKGVKQQLFTKDQQRKQPTVDDQPKSATKPEERELRTTSEASELPTGSREKESKIESAIPLLVSKPEKRGSKIESVVPSSVSKHEKRGSKIESVVPSSVSKPEKRGSKIESVVPSSVSKPEKRGSKIESVVLPSSASKPQKHESKIESVVLPSSASKPQKHESKIESVVLPSSASKPQKQESKIESVLPSLVGKPQKDESKIESGVPSSVGKPQKDESKIESEVPSSVSKPEIHESKIELGKILANPEHQEKAQQRELQAKAVQRELQIKASKNRQKSAKVNSIVERLNKNLPENSAKTVADLLPPPEIPKDQFSGAMFLGKRETEAFPVSVNFPSSITSTIDKTGNKPVNVNDGLDLCIKPRQFKSEKSTILQTSHTDHPLASQEIRQPTVSTKSRKEGTTVETSKESVISITSGFQARNRNVIIEEPTVETHATNVLNIPGFGPFASSHATQLSSIPKDNGREPPIRHPPIVPKNDDDLHPSIPEVPVTEEILEKKETWVCGNEVPPLVDEKLVVREHAWVCGKEAVPVDEKLVVKEHHGKGAVPMDEKLAVKEHTWVCADSDKTASDYSKSDIIAKEELIQTVPIPSTTKSGHVEVVKEKQLGATTDNSSFAPILESVQEVIEDIPPKAVKEKNRRLFSSENVNVDVSQDILNAEHQDNKPPIVSNEKEDMTVKTSEHQNATLEDEQKAILTLEDDFKTATPASTQNLLTVNDIKAVATSLPETSSSEAKAAVKIPPEENNKSVAAIVSDLRHHRQDKDHLKGECVTFVTAYGSEIPLSTSDSDIKKGNSTEQNMEKIESNASESTTAISSEANVENITLATSQCHLPTVDPVEKEPKSVPEMPSSSDKVDDVGQQPAITDKKSKSETKESTSMGSNNTRKTSKSAKDSQEETVQVSVPVPTKVNSSLVLYSESSDSSNDAFTNESSSDNNAIISTSSVKLQSATSEKGTGLGSAGTETVDKIVVADTNDKKESITGSDQITTDLRSTGIDKDITISDLSSSKLEPANEKMMVDASVVGLDNIENATTAELDKINPAEPNEQLQGSTKESLRISKISQDDTSTASTGCKRKAEEDMESLSKLQKLEEIPEESHEQSALPLPEPPFNPIVGDTVEEDVMTITGEGSGAMNEGRNSPFLFNPICGETIEEEVLTIVGDGFGFLNEGSNENSPVSLTVATDVAGSQNESIDSDEDESRETFPTSRGRGGRRGGRGRRGRPPGSGGRNSQPSTAARSNNKGSRGSREVARLGVSVDSVEVNGDNERPVRASRRIAQIRLKEEEERRKLEEERLAQLKAAQMQKKARQEEREKNKGDNQTPTTKIKKGAGRKSLKDETQFAADYVPSGSESEDNSEEEDNGSEFSGNMGKGGKQRKRRKNGKAKKGGNPWATSDEDEEEDQVEEEEEYHEEEEEEELVFKSDHEFSPESDLGEDDDVGPSRHARTAKQDKGDLFEEGNCCKCGKGDHPEWILLCDKCDKGWHASCLRPQLWVVPEGEWFCPPCQHNMLIENLSKNLVEYESLLKRRENEILRKQRLAYVGISLDNVLPDKEPEVPELEQEEEEKVDKERKRRTRRILSDEELSDDFINDTDGSKSRSRSGSSDENSEDEPVYRLRARRTKKAFNFKEYDDMINSALRVDDDEEGVEIGGKMELDEDEDEDDAKLNGDDEKEDEEGVGGGKNEAYLKHLEKQAQEEEETDEELLDEKERLRRKEQKKHGQRKVKRRINDLEAYSDEEDSDDDFKASEAEDEDEELAEDGESEWSGDKMEEDSDDSIAKRARRKDRQGRHGRLGRREKYSDKGLVRRSTRKRRSRISYDESDDDEEEEDQNDKWQSDESEEEEESESNSESDDATWGKRKKKGFVAAKPKLSSFVLGDSSSSKGKGKGGVKRKKRKTDDDDVDRAWNSARGKKDKDEPIERRTRGRKINFKDILDSGESDDDGNVRPKRRPLSDSDDSRSPSSSRRLAEEIRAENARRDKEYEESKAKMAEGGTAGADKPKLEGTDKDVTNNVAPSTMPESLTVAKLAESSVNKIFSKIPKVSPSHSPVQSSLNLSSPHGHAPSPNHLPPISSPMPMTNSPSSLAIASKSGPLSMPPNSSPLHPSSPPSMNLPLSFVSTSGGTPLSNSPSVLPKSPPHIPFIPKSVSSNLPSGHVPSNLSGKPLPSALAARLAHPHISTGHVSSNLSTGPVPPVLSAGSVPPNISMRPMPPNISGPIPPNLSMGLIPTSVPVGSSQKSIISSIPPPVPVPIVNEKKSQKQSKGSRGSRGSKSDKHLASPTLPPSDLELALTKPVKNSALGIPSSKSSKKKDRDRDSSINVPNPSLLMAGAGGVLPELLGVGLPSSLRPGPGVSVSGPTTPSSSSSSSKKGKSSRTTQQTTPPPVSQNLSPSIPIDIDRVPNPALFQGNPGLRPFHPMWAVRNPGPPPQGYSPSGSPVPGALGKPPPLNTSPYSGQQGPPPRPGFSSPPPLRIPNPNTSPLQAFQHFKRDGSLGGPLYRLATGQSQPGVPLPNILPPGMMSPHAGGPERFFGAPPGYPHPYGLLPPHAQGPPQALFPYDYRPPEPQFKDEPAPPRTTASSLPTPVSSASSSPPPTTSAPVPLSTKDEGSAARDSEFGGLVSYFSSQRSEEDMDS